LSSGKGALRGCAAHFVDERAGAGRQLVGSPGYVTIRPHHNQAVLVEFSGRRLGYSDRLHGHSAIRSCALNRRNIKWIRTKTKQHEAAPKKVQRRTSVAKPRVRRS